MQVSTAKQFKAANGVACVAYRYNMPFQGFKRGDVVVYAATGETGPEWAEVHRTNGPTLAEVVAECKQYTVFVEGVRKASFE